MVTSTSPRSRPGSAVRQSSPKTEFQTLCQNLGIRPQRISSVAELSAQARQLSKKRKVGSGYEIPRWIFRAEKYGDNLRTTLERSTSGYFQGLGQAQSVESRVLREFKRRAHHYVGQLPSEKDTLQWLALMQHFGAPTRLMDWTYSIFVALYFSVSRKAPSNSGYIIWALDAEWLRRTANTRMGVKQDIDLVRQFKEADQYRFDEVFRPERESWEKLLPLIYPVNPFQLNERLTIQQGVFLCPRQLRLSFVENLSVMCPTANSMKAFVIDHQSRVELLRELDRMNMSSATLFPGLQGFAESLWTKPICYFPLNVTYDDVR